MARAVPRLTPWKMEGHVRRADVPGHGVRDADASRVGTAEQEFGHARLMSEIDRLRDLPLREGLDVIADLIIDWSGGQLRDDLSLLAIERTD